MDKIRNMSIKKAFITLTILALLSATVLSVLLYMVVDDAKGRIHARYSNDAGATFMNPVSGKNIYVILPSSEYRDKDLLLLTILDYVSMIVPLLFFVVSVIIAAAVFYRMKLKQPIALLIQGASKIAANDLDFQLVYPRKDEMGELCTAFETMRMELYNNNKQMWRLMEERQRLQAVFAHDLRTPLTVLRGYTDLLAQYVPTGQISQEKLLTTVSFLSDHVIRLENYVDTMNSLHHLELSEASPVRINTTEWMDKLHSNIVMITKEQGKTLLWRNEITADELLLDKEIVFRVMENITANAIRFAASCISVRCISRQDQLIIEITDDGPGFSSEDLRLATEPFYTNNTNKSRQSSDEQHLGLGLNICKLLCQKHGGTLQIANKQGGGAQVTAIFSTVVDKK